LDALNNKAANLPATTPFKLVSVMTRPVRAARMAAKTAYGDARDPEEIELHHLRQVIHGQLLQRAAMSLGGDSLGRSAYDSGPNAVLGCSSMNWLASFVGFAGHCCRVG